MSVFDARGVECFERGMAALARADAQGAEAAFRQCLELDPNNAEAWCYLGVALCSKKPEPAVEALDRALALAPNHPGALYWRAEIDWIQGDPRSAARWFRRLSELVPGNTRYLARLGLACLAAGDTDAAMAALDQAVEAGGGIAAVHAHHVELRRAIYLDVLGRYEEAKRLIQAVNGSGLLRKYPTRRYPRDLEEQRCALENVIAGRDVVVLGSGPSLAELQPLLEELGAKGCEDLCFFGFNNVPVAERMLQDTIGRDVDLACMTAAAVMDLHAEWISEFLARTSSPNLFLAPADMVSRSRKIADLVAARSEKLFYFAADGDYPPIPEDPLHFPPVNTLLCVLPLAVLGQPRRIFLFGCDGAAPGAIDGGDVYFRQGSAEYGKQEIPNVHYAKWLARDTFLFNATVPTVLNSLSVLHRVTLPPIYICNPDSAYLPFPRISASGFRSLHACKPASSHIFPARLSQLERRLETLSTRIEKGRRNAKGPPALWRLVTGALYALKSGIPVRLQLKIANAYPRLAEWLKRWM